MSTFIFDPKSCTFKLFNHAYVYIELKQEMGLGRFTMRGDLRHAGQNACGSENRSRWRAFDNRY